MKHLSKQCTAGTIGADVGKSRTTPDTRAFDAHRHDLSERLNLEEALRVSRAQLRRLSAQHISIQESERRRVAADLHDGLGQTLSLAKLTIAEAANSLSGAETVKIKNTLDQATSQIKSALDELRRIAMNLRPSTLDSLGIVATMNWYFRELKAAHSQLKIEVDIVADEAEVPEPFKICIFRIVQEATGNALKHAQADRIKVSLTSAGDFLNLSIEDNGRGFDLGRAAEHCDFTHGIGLQSMRERAELSGACYDIQTSAGNGTRITVAWQLERASDLENPIIPLGQTFAQTMCHSALNSKLVGDLSVSLNCA